MYSRFPVVYGANAIAYITLTRRGCQKDINQRTPTEKQQNGMCTQEDSDQPGHLPSLIKVFAVYSLGS